MSLEQVLIDATAAIVRLTTVLTSAVEAGAVTAAPAPAAEKATRAKKSDAPVVTAVATPAVVTEGTRYFHIPAHNTVYAQLPGMPDCTLPGAMIVSEAEYNLQKAELEKKFPTASAAATPAPATSAPTATAPAADVLDFAALSPVTFEQVVEKLRALHKAKGDTGVASVLAKFGVARVPELNGKVANADILAAIEVAGA